VVGWGLIVAGRGTKGGDGLIERGRHRDDAVEAGGAEEPGERRPGAGHRHLAAQLTDPTDPADEGTQPGGVDEWHPGQVDQQLW